VSDPEEPQHDLGIKAMDAATQEQMIEFLSKRRLEDGV
jgi:hypothetical protein